MVNVGIYGLGYVGLPLALLARNKGFSVLGYDVSDYAKGIAQGKEVDVCEDPVVCAKKADVVIVCVPTPVDGGNLPDLSALKACCNDISKGLRKGQIIVIESTIYPGVIEEVVQPILEESGFKAGPDFYLAHCPERIDPGNKKYDVSNLPRVVGGVNSESTRKAAEFYRKLIDANVVELSSVRAAEATKIVENAFRDINIAFVNELAKSFDKMDIDVLEVIGAASTKPFGFLPHYPGCGVGGHCIPVDPYYLIEKAKQSGFNHRFLSLAREINNSMPEYTIRKTVEALDEAGLSIEDIRICVLGLAYKKDVDDVRQSPAKEIITQLKTLKARVDVYDPYIPDESTLGSLDECLACECLILATDHSMFKKIEEKKLDNVKVIVDGRNFLNKNKFKPNKIVYRGIGRR